MFDCLAAVIITMQAECRSPRATEPTQSSAGSAAESITKTTALRLRGFMRSRMLAGRNRDVNNSILAGKLYM